MKICIYYDSITGNTKKIADAIYETCKDEVVYCGKPHKLQEADLYFVGSWTNKGNCSSVIQNLLSSLKNKKIAYFGTCGFGGSSEYYASLYQRAKNQIDASNVILGHFFCPGKMPEAIKDRYVKLLQEHPEDKKLQVSLKNFEEVKTRPNTEDINKAQSWAKEMIKEALQ